MWFCYPYLDFEKLYSDVSRALKISFLVSHPGLHIPFSFHALSLIWAEIVHQVFFDFGDIFFFKEHRTSVL